MIDLFISSLYFLNNIKYNILSFLFCILLCNSFIKGEYSDCVSNRDLNNAKCFNNIIKFDNGHKYRAGRFVTTKEGELVIEYSEDATDGGHRLFYRLTKDGRGYYDDDNPIKEIDIEKIISTKDEHNNDIQTRGRFEARNALIILDGDTSGKEYLLSTSSWYSLTELHDLESGNYFTFFTSEFFNMEDKYIFSFHYEILREPETYNYFLIYSQYDHTLDNAEKDAFSESYFIRKFKIKFFNETNPYEEITVIENTENENDRIVSAFIMESKQLLNVFYLKYGANLVLQPYQYDLTSLSEIIIGQTEGYPGGTGLFFKALCLNDEHAAFLYYPDYSGTNLNLRIYKYDTTITLKFKKDMYYTSRDSTIIKNEFYKINENRSIFVNMVYMHL